MNQTRSGVPHARIRGLDGLRAIAAGLVLVYHLLPGVAPTGFVGVDVFFVISGFLITSLLIKEWNETGKISVGGFWVRRFKRLVPAVVVATAGSLAIALVLRGDTLVQVDWQALGSLTGTYNWFELANHSSYFNQSSPLLLTNMWSLAVEQQFYLIWPLIVIGLMAFAGRHFRVGFAATLGIASVALHVLWMSDDVTRSYVGTDTHAFGLMIGAIIAFSLPGIMRTTQQTASAWWGVASWLALAALIAGVAVLPSGQWMYPWGMLLASALAGVVVRGILPDVRGVAGRSLATILEIAPMRWLGERSYGIYLWHWPLWVVFFLHTTLPSTTIAGIVLALSILLAHLSYTYVETPFRTRGFEYLTTGVRRTAGKVAALASVLILAMAGTAVAVSHPLSAAEQVVEDGKRALDAQQSQGATAAPTAAAPTAAPTTSAPTTSAPATETPAPDATTTEAPAPAPQPAADDVPVPSTNASKIAGAQVTVVGDSVTLGSAGALLARIPGAQVDAEVSRFPWDFGKVVNTIGMRDYVVVSLAVNGLLDDNLANKILRIAGDRKVVFVTGFGPDRCTWIPPSNEAIKRVAAANPDRVRVADWGAYAKAHQDQLVGDRIHPQGEGREAYAQLIVDALNSF